MSAVTDPAPPPSFASAATGRMTGRPRGLAWWRDRLDDIARTQPARLAIVVFSLVVAVFTALLSLPVATTEPSPAPFVDALFTATSAVCVTGLTTVNTSDYWSGFGEVVILVAIKVGGLGVLTLASLLGLAVSRRLGLRQRLIAATETKALRLGEVGSLLRAVVIGSLIIEGVLALLLAPRFLTLGESPASAAYHGVFYAVSAFNNAGFVSHPGGLQPWAGDGWLLLPIAAGVFIGSLGFPVLVTLARQRRDLLRPSRLNLHTKLTIATTVALLLISVVMFAAFEWGNPATMGPMDTGTKVLTVVFAAVMPRSGGFSTVEIGDMHSSTLLATDMLMFIGGGSASTAGGIKVTTLAVLVLAVVAEARGDDHAEAFGRRLPTSTLRLAVTVVLVGATLVTTASLALLAITDFSLDEVLFEVLSAFATVGLSTGITAELPEEGKYLLTALMFVGRLGTMTLAAALALRERRRMFRLPEERPVVG